MIDHDIHGFVIHGFKKGNRRLQKGKGSLATDAGQDNQTGMDFFCPDKGAKIKRILRDDDKSPLDASL